MIERLTKLGLVAAPAPAPQTGLMVASAFASRSLRRQDAPVDEIKDFVDVPGGYIYRETRGQGPDVVLLNAGAADMRMWETTLPWLTAICRVTTWDYRDTGLSSAGTQRFSEVEDLAAVMTAAHIGSAVLVGCSDGGRRALAFAHRYPERVRRVVVVGGSFGEFPDPNPEETAAREEMREYFARRERVLTEAGMHAAAAADIDAWGPALGPHDRRRMIGLQVSNSHWVMLEDYLGEELDPPVKTRFDEITTPVRVLVGGRDFRGTALWARRLASQAPDATLRVIPEADHFPMLSAPEAFEHFLRDAVSEPGQTD